MAKRLEVVKLEQRLNRVEAEGRAAGERLEGAEQQLAAALAAADSERSQQEQVRAGLAFMAQAV